MGIFTDEESGYIRFNSTYAATIGDGLYYHTASFGGRDPNPTAGNQLAEMVPVDRIIAQWRGFLGAARAHKVFILNPSDLRPVPLTTDFVLRMAWDPAPFIGRPAADDNATAYAFYSDWCGGGRWRGRALPGTGKWRCARCPRAGRSPPCGGRLP